ncbi:unnamed protein product [Peronospora farinosa]|uniref:Uncharacterized protein n=1 Tax=Peronospora farinosa TaxID=134698 RepID=A0AAV0TKZ8_9STRA|nr:unnamed protein product [Peronospora farinosa]CAI5723720.1 unnamed protein product [Peronospora farinosa]
MDTVHRVIEYVEEFPPEAGAIELKSQLRSFTLDDLRAACSRLKLSMRNKQKKKSGFISVLVSYWKTSHNFESKGVKTPLKASETSVKTGIELPYDVAQFVQHFPPHGCIKELQNQLDACRSRTLRSACVLIGLQPKKNFTKKGFLHLLVAYWQDSLVMTPTVSFLEETPKEEEVKKVVQTKRVRFEESDLMKTPTKNKKIKTLKDKGDVCEKKEGALATSMEKAQVVKEWASAIEMLSRVEGSTRSIEAICKIIERVVDSASSELCES